MSRSVACAIGTFGSEYAAFDVSCSPLHSAGSTPFRGWYAYSVALRPLPRTDSGAGCAATARHTKGLSYTLPCVMLLPFLSHRPTAPRAELSAYGRLLAHAVPTGMTKAKPAATAAIARRLTTRVTLLLFATVMPSGATSAGLRGDCAGAEPRR